MAVPIPASSFFLHLRPILFFVAVDVEKPYIMYHLFRLNQSINQSIVVKVFSAGSSAGFEQAPFFLATAISLVSLAVRVSYMYTAERSEKFVVRESWWARTTECCETEMLRGVLHLQTGEREKSVQSRTRQTNS